MKHVLMSVALFAVQGALAGDGVDALAFYYPHWHVYPRGEQWFGKGWTEWEFVKTQVPRYPGHPVPIKPLMGYYDESKPENVEKEIDLAADAGIGAFLFDWYCYDGEVIMEEALERGFLKAKNLSRMKFALMWCYHDRYNRFRAAIDDVPGKLLIRRAGTPDEFRTCMDIVIDRFLGHPQYYRKDGHPFYSIFNAPEFVKRMGGPAAARRLLEEVDAKVTARGLPSIHWNGIQVKAAQVAEMKAAGFHSCAVYNVTCAHLPDYSKRYLSGEQVFEYKDVADAHRRRWSEYDATDLPYLPTVTRGWDCSGRCRNDEPMPWKSGAYPYGGIVRNNDVETFRRLLADAKARVEADPKKPGIILLNAWNEYTEGCWLVPDENIGDASLRAVRSVMRPTGKIGETDRWQAEIDRVAAAGGGRVTIPAGRHLVGQLDLKSGVELHLEKGAVLEAAYGLENYRVVTLPYSEGTWSAIIMGLNVTNVAVTGEGTIDGQGPKWPPTPKGFKGCHESLRPRGLFFAYSKDIRLEGYTLRNTACWGQVFKNCDGVTARNITVFNHGNMNNDGFDIEAKNVLIENCVLDTNDDQFCIKSNDPDFTVENVTIRDCIARGQASAFKIGTATRGVVRHVRVSNLRCEPTQGIFNRYADGTPCDFLYHLTVYQRPENYPYGFGLIGIAIECVDGGCVEDVVVDGVEFVDGFKIPIFVRADNRKHHHEDDGLRRGGHNVLRNVTIRNVKGYAMGPVASSITGVKDFRVKDVRLENIDIVQPGAGEVASKLAMAEPLPYQENRYPTPDIFYPGILPAYGLYIDHADGVTLSNVTFRIQKEGPVDLRPAVVRTGR